MRPRFVVTGGAGFLGSHLCDRLLQDDADVVCVDNLVTGRRENVAHLRSDSHFSFIQHDVSEGLDIGEPVQAVLHLASPASPIDYGRLPMETLRAGSFGTYHALELASRHGARFVLTSTSEVYGEPLLHPQPEHYWGNVNPVGPRSVYDESKRFSEALAAAHRRTHGTNTGIVRLFNSFGPRMRAEDGRVIPTFIGQALRGDPLTVAGDGSQTRSLCFVSDTVEGIVRMLHSSAAGPVNIGHPQELTVVELARLIRSLTASGSTLAFVDRPVDDPTQRRPDISLARQVLDWKPVVDLETGLARTVAWYRDEISAAMSRARSIS